jgi:membrane protease YdiL (CAAX protease family)
MTDRRWRAVVAFVLLFVLYQSAEGIGMRWLHSFALQATLMTACLAVAWPLSHWLGYRGYGAYALDWRRGWWGWLLGGLAAALAAKYVAIQLGLHAGIYTAAAESPASWGAMAVALPMLLLSTFVPSLAEDILARGFWFRAAGLRWRSGIAFVLFSAGYFVLNHLYRLERGPLEWLMIFCMGLAYATALWRNGRLWAALGLHWGWNLANGLLSMAVPYEVARADRAPWLTVLVHLVLLGVLVLWPRRAPLQQASGTGKGPERSRP